MLGDAHLAAGNSDEAIAAFSEALEHASPGETNMAMRVVHCIDALANLGRLDEAIEKLGKMRGQIGDSPELAQLTSDLDARKKTGRGGVDLVGLTVDRYKVLDLLGEGGTAWVYEAEHTVLGRRVALKLLKPSPTGGADLATRFYAEAEAVAGLKHPNVIHVFDVGATPGGLLYMALELVKGDALRRLLEKQGHLSIPQATRIMSGILAGLGAAHEQGIVHRDMKPENVLLLGETPKVVDFGIAKVVQGKVHTMTGAFLGTPKYASPEQASGQGATFATDIYACGLILYELLSGRSPFESETPLGFLTQHATVAPLPLTDLVTDAPKTLAAAVMRALEKDPAERWPDVWSFRRAIAPFIAPDGAEPAKPTDRRVVTMIDVDQALEDEAEAT
jgi:serine/threonine-protein kinase